MAVVFISPKQRQKMFILGITIMFLLLLLIISFAVFLSQPKPVPPELVFNRPKIDINMKLFESDQFKNLKLFEEIKMQFEYTAIAADNKTKKDIISAVSIEEARQILEDQDLTVVDIKEAGIGRENPFMPYSRSALPQTGR